VAPHAGSFTVASTIEELAEVAADALVLPALDAWPAPRVILTAARRARTVVVGARGPATLTEGREPVIAADLAEAVSAAGLQIRSFETLAGESFLWAERAPLSS
jgi:hypothetical protein